MQRRGVCSPEQQPSGGLRLSSGSAACRHNADGQGVGCKTGRRRTEDDLDAGCRSGLHRQPCTADDPDAGRRWKARWPAEGKADVLDASDRTHPSAASLRSRPDFARGPALERRRPERRAGCPLRPQDSHSKRVRPIRCRTAACGVPVQQQPWFTLRLNRDDDMLYRQLIRSKKESFSIFGFVVYLRTCTG